MNHEDTVHDISYDYYGKRIATCSSDHKIKIWKVDEGGVWNMEDEFTGHDSAVIRVVWAHPEFGNVIASCSLDRSVRIWEEQMNENGKRWIEKARLLDSKGSVRDIAFAPNWMGLKLATCSTDGFVRIYEAFDVVNLAHWTFIEDFEIFHASKEIEGQCCLSWCQSKAKPPMLIVSCAKENTAKIFQFSEESKKWKLLEVLTGHSDVVQDVAWAPNIGKSYELIATGCRDNYIRIFKYSDKGVEKIAEFDDHKANIWKLQFNVTGNILASSGDDGTVRLWKGNFMNEWNCISVISEKNK